MTRLIPAVLIALTAASSAQQPPVFRTGVQFVSVDVVVTDGDDRPIRDLTKDDFEIIDRGRIQAVTDFRFVDIPAGRAELADLKAMPPASDVASNTSASADARLFVMIVDTLHTLESEIVPMKQMMTEFIRSISPVDEVAITYPNRSDLGTNFTTDRQKMIRVIDQVGNASGFAVDARGLAVASLGSMDGERAARTLAWALKNTALALAGSTHPRRAIVYVGGGTPANMSGDASTMWTVFDEYKDAYRVAREANVPIYTLDPRGMVDTFRANRPGSSASRLTASSRTGSFSLKYQKDNLYVAAANTGGRAFVDQSNITRAMEALVEENGSFYLLGFYPDTTPRTDRFNEIEVRVKRPGVKVRARAGYHAAARVDNATPVDERLASAMTSALDVRGLALRASVSPLLPTRDRVRTAVTVHVTYPAGVGTDLPVDSLRFQLLALDGDARVKESVERAYTVRPPRQGQAETTLVINDVIDLPSQPLTLRIGIASEALGRAGTLQVAVHVPKPSESKIQMGGVVIGASGEAGPATLGTDFIKAILPFQPTTRRAFTQEQTLRIFAPVFWRGRETEATVTLTLEGAGVTLRRDETLTVAQPVDGRRVTALDTLIPLDQLSGDFTLTLEARVKDGQSATRVVTFEVRGPGSRVQGPGSRPYGARGL